MKLWICRIDETLTPYAIFYSEPEWEEELGGWMASSRYNDEGWDVCKGALKEMGFVKLPKGEELCEYDLSGAKPKFLCCWIPDPKRGDA